VRVVCVQPCPSILSAREGGSDGKAAKPSGTAKVGRRGFLAGAAAASGGAGMTTPALAGPGGLARQPRATLPLQLAAAEREPSAAAGALTTDRSGSDYMADVLKALPIEYMVSNPGSTFRGRHESFINYGGDKTPELLACCHEESSVGIAHGHAKTAGRPMAVVCGTVGLQHAALVAGAELILAIEPVDLWGALSRFRDQLVRTGAQLRQPAGDMPPCGDKVLSDRQITDIFAFLKTVPRPPAVASIPLLH
jgi:hypothetical protein